jgi:hypothetical protein
LPSGGGHLSDAGPARVAGGRAAIRQELRERLEEWAHGPGAAVGA